MDMKWKNQIWVFDDIIPMPQQEQIKKTLLGTDTQGSGFPWNYVPDVTGSGSQDKRPAFSHTFMRDGAITTHQSIIKMLEPLWGSCMGKIKEKTKAEGKYTPMKSRAFLQMPLCHLKGGEYDSHHIDLTDEHFALLYYVCDADGDTVIFDNMYSKDNPHPPEPAQLKEKIRVTPKQGRVVIFDGYYWHTATQPSQAGIRCVINTDIIQHG